MAALLNLVSNMYLNAIRTPFGDVLEGDVPADLWERATNFVGKPTNPHEPDMRTISGKAASQAVFDICEIMESRWFSA